MNAFSIGPEIIGGLVDASTGLLLVAKWTVFLALAWLVHAALTRRNPRWRVILWRGTMVAIAVAAVLSMAPPLVNYQVAVSERASAFSLEDRFSSALVDDSAAPIVQREFRFAARAAPEPTLEPDHRIAPHRERAAADPSLVAAPSRDPIVAWSTRLICWLTAIWLIGVVILTSRMMAGNLRLCGVIRRSAGVTQEVFGECRTIAARLQYAKTVRVRRSPEISSETGSPGRTASLATSPPGPPACTRSGRFPSLSI
jgi:hypothetical protein